MDPWARFVYLIVQITRFGWQKGSFCIVLFISLSLGCAANVRKCAKYKMQERKTLRCRGSFDGHRQLVLSLWGSSQDHKTSIRRGVWMLACLLDVCGWQLILQLVIPNYELLTSIVDLSLLTQFWLHLLKRSASHRRWGHRFHMHWSCRPICLPAHSWSGECFGPLTTPDRVYRPRIMACQFCLFHVDECVIGLDLFHFLSSTSKLYSDERSLHLESRSVKSGRSRINIRASWPIGMTSPCPSR